MPACGGDVRWQDVTLSVRIGVETGTAVVGPAGGAGSSRVTWPLGAAIGTRSRAPVGGSAKLGTSRPGYPCRHRRDLRVGTEPSACPWRTDDQPLYGYRSRCSRWLRPAAEVGAASAWPQGLRSSAGGPRSRCSAEAVRATVSGRGAALIVIAGEAGLGKSRLVGECRNYFMGWVGAASGRLPLWLEGRCASYASSTPYGAYQQLLSRFIGAPLEAGEAVVRPALEAAMRAVFGKDKEALSLLARMLGLPGRPNEAHVDGLDPRELQEQTFSAVRAMLASLISRGPTVLALEDLHWSDPTSLRLTAEPGCARGDRPAASCLGRVGRNPTPALGDLEARALCRCRVAHCGSCSWRLWTELEERNLARWLLGGEVDEGVLEMVCEGVDGNPLFLEERLASLIDTGAVQQGSAGWRTGPGTTDAVPEALERLIRSRADRLSPAAREAIVAASVFGRQDRACCDRRSERADGRSSMSALAELVSGGFLTEDGHEPEPLYRFRHALIRDAVYRGLLRPERRRLHARAAWHMEASCRRRP